LPGRYARINDSIRESVMRQQGSSTLICAVLLTCGAAVCGADPVDWHYCIAPEPARHAIYLSPAFASPASMDTLESAFARDLDSARVQHEAVQCPRADAEAIGAMRQHAIDFNERAGNRVVQIDWAP
jgi:hypothetical protein